MPKFRVKRHCFYALTPYHEGQVAEFDKDPKQPELFERMPDNAKADAAPPPDPAGQPVSRAEAAAAARKRRGAGKAGGGA